MSVLSSFYIMFSFQGETSVYHIDPSHDLGLEIHIDGFKPSHFKFPRLETFSTTAKFSENKFSLSETLTFESSNLRGNQHFFTFLLFQLNSESTV